jgi:LacI family transcriptional regulator
MKFLQGKNIRIPEDIQIIGFDDSMASKESNPSLTTIHQEANLRQLNVWRQCAVAG